MNESKKNELIQGVSFFVMALVFIAPQRSFLSRHQHGFNYYWTEALALLGIAFVLILLRSTFFKRENFKKFIICSLPLLVYFAIDVSFLVYGYMDLGSTGRFVNRWWVNYALLLLLLPSAWALGYALKWDVRKQSTFMVVVFALMLALVFSEYLMGIGVDNPLGNIVRLLNKHTDKIWKWNPAYEPLRVTGLHTFPSILATMALVGMVWSLSVKATPSVRLFIFLSGLFMIFLSGSRTELLTSFVVCFVALWRKIKTHGVKGWLERSLHFILIGLCIVLVIGSYSYIKLNPSGSAGVISRLSWFEQFTVDDSQNDMVFSDREVLNQLSSYRVDRWAEAVRAIAEHPLGTGLPSGVYLTTTHAHNDILSKYITEGPLGVIMIFVMLWWFSSRSTRKDAPCLGLYLATMFAGVMMLDNVFVHYPILTIPLFLLGNNVELPSDQRASVDAVNMES